MCIYYMGYPFTLCSGLHRTQLRAKDDTFEHINIDINVWYIEFFVPNLISIWHQSHGLSLPPLAHPLPHRFT